mmetsp:Transcript_163/g.293  ORF Transcript_163/g.293 Transcript_163/m.293 type:complete len:213 (-) Transcript_163:1986-2624(-)
MSRLAHSTPSTHASSAACCERSQTRACSSWHRFTSRGTLRMRCSISCCSCAKGSLPTEVLPARLPMSTLLLLASRCPTVPTRPTSSSRSASGSSPRAARRRSNLHTLMPCGRRATSRWWPRIGRRSQRARWSSALRPSRPTGVRTLRFKSSILRPAVKCMSTPHPAGEICCSRSRAWSCHRPTCRPRLSSLAYVCTAASSNGCELGGALVRS